MKPDLSVNVAGMRMKNPIMPASGTFAYGEEMAEFFDLSRLGAVITKGTTLLPRQGNEPPRTCETTAGMINYIGLANPGAEAVIKEKIPFLLQFGVPIIVNICGATTEEYVKLVRRFNGVVGVEALEINISCPNTQHGGIAFGQDAQVAFALIQEVRQQTSLPLIVKLTPNVTDIVAIAESIKRAGANAVSLVNTFKARAKIRSGPHKGKWIEGGLSGPCIKPIALRLVSDLAKAKIGIPIIGIGGIMCWEDVLDFLESGADAVQIGTANFLDPTIMIKIIDGLTRYLTREGFPSLAAWRQKQGKPS